MDANHPGRIDFQTLIDGEGRLGPWLDPIKEQSVAYVATDDQREGWVQVAVALAGSLLDGLTTVPVMA